MHQKSKVYTFSANGEDAIWLDGLRKRLEGRITFSQAMLEGAKLRYEKAKDEDYILQLRQACDALELDFKSIIIGTTMQMTEASRQQEELASYEDRDILDIARDEKDS